MPRDSNWSLVVVALAFLDGAVSGLRVNLGVLLTSAFGLPMSAVGASFGVVSALDLLFSPVGVAVASYLWGTRADVAARYRQFGLRVTGAVVAGFVAFNLLSAGLVVAERDIGYLVTVATGWLFALGLLGVPLIAVGSAAIGQFRTSQSAGPGE
jgi:hypothetical protein